MNFWLGRGINRVEPRIDRSLVGDLPLIRQVAERFEEYGRPCPDPMVL